MTSVILNPPAMGGRKMVPKVLSVVVLSIPIGYYLKTQIVRFLQHGFPRTAFKDQLPTKLPQMMVCVLVGKIADLFFCHFSEEGMNEVGI